MELHDLIAAVKAAPDKDSLAELVKTELGLDLNRRKSLAELRDSVLAGLAIEPEQRPDTPAPVAPPDIAAALPDIGETPSAEQEAPKQRILRNKKTGRVFVWTPELAKLSDLEEV